MRQRACLKMERQIEERERERVKGGEAGREFFLLLKLYSQGHLNYARNLVAHADSSSLLTPRDLRDLGSAMTQFTFGIQEI